jgi:Flp pilus assembly protein TadB
MARPESEEVHSITSAREPYSAQVDHRERNYLISMAIRVACFIAFVGVDHWVRWVFLVGAVLLPYVAVVIGNSAVRNVGDGPSPFGVDRKQLGQ